MAGLELSGADAGSGVLWEISGWMRGAGEGAGLSAERGAGFGSVGFVLSGSVFVTGGILGGGTGADSGGMTGGTSGVLPGVYAKIDTAIFVFGSLMC